MNITVVLEDFQLRMPNGQELHIEECAFEVNASGRYAPRNWDLDSGKFRFRARDEDDREIAFVVDHRDPLAQELVVRKDNAIQIEVDEW